MKHKKEGRNRRAKSALRPSRKKPEKKALTLWDQASRWYDSLVGSQGTDFQKDIIMPGVLRLLDVAKKDRVLDLACGQGVFSRYLSQKGINVEGLDSSAELLKYARTRSGSSIRYHVGDAADAKNFKEVIVFGKELGCFVETIGEHNEYLVDIDYLIKCFEDNGFKLIENSQFDSLFESFNIKLLDVEKEFTGLYNKVILQKI